MTCENDNEISYTDESCFETDLEYSRYTYDIDYDKCIESVEEWEFDTGETKEAFCEGTGTNYGMTLQNYIEGQGLIDPDPIEPNELIEPISSETSPVSPATLLVPMGPEAHAVGSSALITIGRAVGPREGPLWYVEQGIIKNVKKVYEIVDSYDIDYDKCIESFEGFRFDTGETKEVFCEGTGTRHGWTLNLFINDEGPSWYEEQGIIKSVKKSYKTLQSYNIDKTKCVEVLKDGFGYQDGETPEALCEGTGTSYGMTLNVYINDGEALWFEQDGIITNTEWQTVQPKINVIITGYKDSCPKKVVIPSEISKGPIVEIDEYAMSNSNLTSVKLENTNIRLGNCAFGPIEELKSHNLPDSYLCIKPREPE